jgi:hypothetical protein
MTTFEDLERPELAERLALAVACEQLRRWLKDAEREARRLDQLAARPVRSEARRRTLAEALPEKVAAIEAEAERIKEEQAVELLVINGERRMDAMVKRKVGALRRRARGGAAPPHDEGVRVYVV